MNRHYYCREYNLNNLINKNQGISKVDKMRILNMFNEFNAEFNTQRYQRPNMISYNYVLMKIGDYLQIPLPNLKITDNNDKLQEYDQIWNEIISIIDVD